MVAPCSCCGTALPPPPAEFDEEGFRLRFPLFASVATFPAAMLLRHFAMARLHITGGKTLYAILGQVWELMTAHLAHLEHSLATGNTAGLVNSASIDKVSVSLTPPPAKNQFEYWLNLTPYGQQLLFLLKQKAAGGFVVGGTPAERDAFRKAGGVFTKRKA